jgi:hypothetical protein
MSRRRFKVQEIEAAALKSEWQHEDTAEGIFFVN